MEFFLQDGMGPFTFFATMIVLLLLLEIMLMTIGLSTQIGGDADVGVDMDASIDMPELEIDLPDGVEIVNETPDAGTVSSGGILDTLGMKKVPLTIWFTLFSAAFSSLGIVVQSLLYGFFGFILASGVASAIVLIPALNLTRAWAEAVRNWIPQMETTSISERSFARKKGVITVGVARPGSPAQVRVKDHHGNLHYVMVEPLSDEEIPEGSEVLIVRVRDKNEPKMVYRLIRT